MFNPVSSKKLHRQVFDQIQGLIADGQLKPGDRLPSERDLCELLKVSRNSVREALRALETLGIIECRHGGGNYIKLDISSGILEPLSLIFRLHRGSFMDILEMRRILEEEAASLCAAKITDNMAFDLNRIVSDFEKSSSEKNDIRLDKEFHLKIAEYSGNILLLTMLTAISSLLERSIKDGRKAIVKSFSSRTTLVNMHKDICKAICSGKPVSAVKAVNRHFRIIVDNLKPL